MRLCVYCGSSAGADPAYLTATRQLARLLAERGVGLVFGGGAIGLMGALATAYVEAAGRELIGVIPEKFGRKLAHPRITELHIPRTMHARKQIMFDLSDGFITLPGGVGTLEEVMEVLTWARSGDHGKPIGLLDVNGYYRRLREFLDEMRDQGFCSATDRSMLIEDSSPERLLDRMSAYQAPVLDAWWRTAEAGARTDPAAAAIVAAAATGPREPAPPLARFDPFLPEFLRDPYPSYARYRAADPVHWGMPQVPGSSGCWYVFRHRDVQAVLRDPVFTRKGPPGAGSPAIQPPASQQPFLAMSAKWLLSVDPPDHTRLRGLVSKAFSPSVLDEMRRRIQRFAEALVERLRGVGTFDIAAQYASPLSIQTITGILGVRAEDVDAVCAWSTAIGDGINLRMDATAIEDASESTVHLSRYFRGLIAQRRARPEDDLLSSLIAARDRDDKLSEEELLSMCIQLIFAGYETTASHIASGVLALLRHPEQLALLRRRPELIGRAAAELMRYDSPVQTAAVRRPTADVELGGRLIRAGEPVLAFIGSANRDAEVFSDPDRLDIEQARSSVVFGGGLHACVGAALARIEGEIAIGTLVRVPTLELASEDVEWRPHVVLRGPRAVHVRV